MSVFVVPFVPGHYSALCALVPPSDPCPRPPPPFSAPRGFTPYAREDYLEWKKEGRLVSQGVHTLLLGHRCEQCDVWGEGDQRGHMPALLGPD